MNHQGKGRERPRPRLTDRGGLGEQQGLMVLSGFRDPPQGGGPRALKSGEAP